MQNLIIQCLDYFSFSRYFLTSWQRQFCFLFQIVCHIQKHNNWHYFNFFIFSSLISLNIFFVIKNYSQTCAQRPPSGPEKSGRCSEVAVSSGLTVFMKSNAESNKSSCLFYGILSHLKYKNCLTLPKKIELCEFRLNRPEAGFEDF